MKKSEFIDILISSTPAELNAFIESKGKGSKPICPVIFHKDSEEPKERDK